MRHVSFQIALQRKLLHAYGTNILFDTRMGCKMIGIVRANGESFHASVTSIPGRIFMDMPNVFGQTTLTCVREGTLWAHESLANGFSPGVITDVVGQRRGVLKRWTQFSGLVWFGERWRFSSDTSAALSDDKEEAGITGPPGITWPPTEPPSGPPGITNQRYETTL